MRVAKAAAVAILLFAARLPAQAPIKVGTAQRAFVPEEPYCWRGAKTHALLTTIWYPADPASVEQPQPPVRARPPGPALSSTNQALFSTALPSSAPAADTATPWGSLSRLPPGFCPARAGSKAEPGPELPALHQCHSGMRGSRTQPQQSGDHSRHAGDPAATEKEPDSRIRILDVAVWNRSPGRRCARRRRWDSVTRGVGKLSEQGAIQNRTFNNGRSTRRCYFQTAPPVYGRTRHRDSSLTL